jgi:hypothetical protein
MSPLRWLLPLFILPFAILTGCQDDLVPGQGSLDFSEDTVIFDTVFTTIGSITRQFKVYNPSSDEVTISSIYLAGGQQSKYRLNVDGTPGIIFSNVTIQGNDSMFVFVDVTLDPNNQSGPAMVTDSVIFVTDGVQQDVDLAACGWDAIFYYPTNYLEGLGAYSIIECPNMVWTSAKPIVIYGTAVVDSACTLDIEAGTRIFSHKSSGILVYRDGTLHVNGVQGNEVVFASDRLDEFYVDQSGEWDRIWLAQGSKDNTINYAIIKNGNVGVQVDFFNETSPNPTLRMSNTVIENMAGASIFGQTAKIDAYNCVFGSGGQFSAALTLGGTYNFRHCTFANYWVNGNRQTPALLQNNWYEAQGQTYAFDYNAYFGNCIIYGNNLNELDNDVNTSGAFNFQFERCLIRVNPDDVDVSNASQFVDIIYNEDPNFKDASENKFELDTLSPAKDVGYMSIVNAIAELQNDLNGNPRTFDLGPDLGAFERQE